MPPQTHLLRGGGDYFFVDLVFYHRLLKCHVLVELKVGEFFHKNTGQLKAYINYYRTEIMVPGDNPPMGLFLVTEKNYGTTGFFVGRMSFK